MKILKISAISFICALLTISTATAEVRLGLSAGFAHLEVDGKETLKDTSVITTHSEQANVIIPSIFAEFATDGGFGIGFDWVPGSADLSASNRTRIANGQAGQGNDTGNNVANAEIDGLSTIYLHKTFSSGMFLKVGHSSADVNTTETLASGSTYGNTSVDGVVLGLGFTNSTDSGAFFRASVEYTDYDDISLTSQVADAVTATTNKIDASVDATVAKLSIGKSF